MNAGSAHSPFAYVETPLGRLKFYVDFVGGHASDLKIFQGELEPVLPQGMSVAACFAVLLQLKVTEEIVDFVFHCDWEALKANGFANPGEGLDAWEWEQSGHVVAVGTEDSDWLCARLSVAPFSIAEYPIKMERNKVAVKVPKLLAGTLYAFHFVVAWNPIPEPQDCSCWFAVDVPHKVVVQRLANAG